MELSAESPMHTLQDKNKMPPLAAAASSSSSRCGPFACQGGGGAEQKARGLQAQAAAPAAAARQGCGRPLGRAAGLVGGGIAAAFFVSLERCACVDVRTADDLADYAEAAAPLRQHAGAATRKGRRTAAGAGKGRRGGGGFGCCENIN